MHLREVSGLLRIAALGALFWVFVLLAFISKPYRELSDAYAAAAPAAEEDGQDAAAAAVGEAGEDLRSNLR